MSVLTKEIDRFMHNVMNTMGCVGVDIVSKVTIYKTHLSVEDTREVNIQTSRLSKLMNPNLGVDYGDYVAGVINNRRPKDNDHERSSSELMTEFLDYTGISEIFNNPKMASLVKLVDDIPDGCHSFEIKLIHRTSSLKYHDEVNVAWKFHPNYVDDADIDVDRLITLLHFHAYMHFDGSLDIHNPTANYPMIVGKIVKTDGLGNPTIKGTDADDALKASITELLNK